MAVLIDLLLFLTAVSGPTPVDLHTPGAQYARVSVTRQIMSDNAPWFTGAVFAYGPTGQVTADCSDTPWWKGQTRYPCWPQTMVVPADGVWTFTPVDDTDGSVVVHIQVVGLPPSVYLPMMAR